ncbi:hypothetical protein ACT2CV_05285 [Pasteurellaceae bacterium 22721_9_1]
MAITAKLFLIVFLLCCILLASISGLSLYFGLASPLILYAHISCGLVLILLAIIHFVHRRKKFLKLVTQFQDLYFGNPYPSFCNLDRLLMTFEPLTLEEISTVLQLPLTQIQQALVQGKVPYLPSNQPLRHLVGDNDEKLFSAITIILQLRFPSNRRCG